MTQLSRIDVPGVTKETNDLLHVMQDELVRNMGRWSVDGQPISVEMHCLSLLELCRRLMSGHRSVSDLKAIELISQQATRVTGQCKRRAEYYARLANTPPDQLAHG